MKRLILFIIFTGLVCVNSFSQKRLISQDEFFSVYAKASDLTDSSKWRITTEATEYKNGKIINTVTKINEIVDENNQKFILVEKKKGKVNKTEWIKIKSDIFIRKNEGKWLKTNNWQDGSVDRVTIGNPEYTVETVVTDNNKSLLLQSFTKYDFENTQRFFLYKIYLNMDGYITKTELSSGVFSPRLVEYKEISIYEYSPQDLKIERPIKWIAKSWKIT